jgi:hypothetical protein
MASSCEILVLRFSKHVFPGSANEMVNIDHVFHCYLRKGESPVASRRLRGGTAFTKSSWIVGGGYCIGRPLLGRAVFIKRIFIIGQFDSREERESVNHAPGEALPEASGLFPR